MNSTLKSLTWVAVALVTLYFGVRFQKEREIRDLTQQKEVLTGRAAELAKDLVVTRTKLQAAEAESTVASTLEAQHNASLENITAEQQKVDDLMARWSEAEAERAASVAEVRERAATQKPVTYPLPGGKEMKDVVVRSVPDENTVSVEYANGLVKLKADEVPEKLKAMLGLGWRPIPPPRLTLDKDGNAVVKAGAIKASGESAASEVARELATAETDSTSIPGLSRALTKVDALLKKSKADYEAQRLKVKKWTIFKKDLSPAGSNMTYGELRQEGNNELVRIAGRVQALKAEKAKIEHKLKSM